MGTNPAFHHSDWVQYSVNAAILNINRDDASGFRLDTLSTYSGYSRSSTPIPLIGLIPTIPTAAVWTLTSSHKGISRMKTQSPTQTQPPRRANKHSRMILTSSQLTLFCQCSTSTQEVSQQKGHKIVSVEKRGRVEKTTVRKLNAFNEKTVEASRWEQWGGEHNS